MATYKDDLDILNAAVKDSNKLSLNAITELDNKGILGMYGGGSGKAIPDAFGLMLYAPSMKPVPTPKGLPSTTTYYEFEYVTKDYEYVKAAYEQQEDIRLTAVNSAGQLLRTFASCSPALSEYGDQILEINSNGLDFLFLPNGKVYICDNGGGQ